MTSPRAGSSEPATSRGSGLPPKWVPVIIAALGSAWALWYVWDTGRNSYGDQDTVLLINFLIWPLVIAAVAVVAGALRGQTTENPIGLSDPRRLLLVLSIPIFGTALNYFGFILPSVLFVLLAARILGTRNPMVLCGLAVLVIVVIWFGFAYLMSVPVPLWPSGVAI